MSVIANAECPVCGTPISQTRYSEIQTKIRSEEQAKTALLTDRLRVQHAAELQAAIEKAAKQAARDAAQKLAQAQTRQTQQAERITQLEQREATMRANAAQTQEQLKAKHADDLKAAKDSATKQARESVLAELKAKDAEVRKLKEGHAKELKQQREALDEHTDLEVQKIRSNHARESEALQRKVLELNRKLEQKTSHELGELPEIDLHRALCEAFRGDSIRRVQKGKSGADVIHEVMHKGQICGTIIYDSKNRKLWQPGFVQKLLIDQANAKAEHAILVTSVFPSGKRDLCANDGVILAKPSQVVTVATLLRDSVVTHHLRNLSLKDRTEKKERLYALLTSELFRQRMTAVERACRDLEKIDVDEADEHRRVWKKRNALYKTVDKSVHDLVTDVNVILETNVQGATMKNSSRSAAGTAARFSF